MSQMVFEIGVGDRACRVPVCVLGAGQVCLCVWGARPGRLLDEPFLSTYQRAVVSEGPVIPRPKPVL